MNVLRQRWRDMRLSTRIIGMSLILFLLVQLVGFSVVRSSIASNARAQIRQELESGERVWQRVLTQNAERLRQGAALLAADYGFRSAVNSDDNETIRSALDNHGNRIGARVVAHLDAALRLNAVSAVDNAPLLEHVLNDVAARLAQNPQASQVALVGAVPYRFVMVPMRAPLVIGWVLMGFPIDQALADELNQLLSVHVAILSRVGSNESLVVSTLPGLALQDLSSQSSRSGELVVDGNEMVTRTVSLLRGQGEVDAVLLRSISAVMAPYQQLQVTLAVITTLGALLFALGSTLTARRVTQPLRLLLAFSNRVRDGDYASPMKLDKARGDELGRLADSFEHMRESVARQQHEILQLAYWDRLTGLPNRAQFREAVRSAISAEGDTAGPDEGPVSVMSLNLDRFRSEDESVSVITLNLDRFKHVNDVLGYEFGDELLRAVAQRLSEHVVRDSDMVARLAGDEFAILLCGAGAEGAKGLSQRITQAFTVPLTLNGQTVDISAGIGIACWPDDGEGADLLISHAEIAMYAAKTRTVGILKYEPALDSSSAQNLSLLTDLRHALENDDLRLFLQPKIRVSDGKVIAAEALVRWQHPERGLIPPMQFIPFAEQTGFVRQLTLWMFDMCVRNWASLQQEGAPLRVAINLSTRDLLDMEFPDRLGAMLARHGVPAEGFCLEITESAIMDDPQRAEATLNRLSDQGFKLSIDDFGTGYSSLAYLKRLPVHELKIDKSFVMAMEHDESDAKIVRSTIDLAHNLGLTVVAEGVENAEILEKLRELQCDEAQGYYMSRPVPLPDFLRWKAQWTAPTADAV